MAQLITNIPSVAENNPGATLIAPTPSQVRPTVSRIASSISAPPTPVEINFGAIQTKMKEIQDEQDFDTKARKLVELDALYGQTVTEAVTYARKTAELQFNIPKLQEHVKFMEQKDRQHPMWQRYLTDSAETEAAKKRVFEAERQAEIYTERLVKQNGPLQAMESSLKTFKAIQSRLLEGMIQRRDVTMQKAEQFLSAISPDVKEAVLAARPDLAGNDLGFAKFMEIELLRNKKEWEPILSGALSDQGMVMQAALGNNAAAMVLTAKQAKASGMDKKEVEADIRGLRKFVKDPIEGDKLIKGMRLLTGEDLKKYTQLAMSPNPTDKKQVEEIRANLAPYVMQNVLQQRVQNVEKWSQIPGQPSVLAMTAAGQVIESFKKSAGRGPNAEEFHAAFINQKDLTPQQKVERSEMFKNELKTRIRLANKNAYGLMLDEADIINKMIVRGVLSNPSFGQALGAAVGAGLESAYNDWIANPYSPVGSVARAGSILNKQYTDLVKGVYEGFTGQ